MSALNKELARILGEDSLRLGRAAEPYTHDSTELQALFGVPDAVVVPSDAPSLRRLVEWCYSHDVPIVPRGGGTGFAGGAVAVNGGVVCSLERINRILQFDPSLWRIRVEAGVTTGRLQQLCLASGVYFPPDPGASEASHIGGNIACNAGGPHSFKYGVTGNWVTGLDAIIASGVEVSFGGAYRKDAAGYDFRSLLIGSEGTLGIITSAWLRLIPTPETEVTVIAAYPSIADGVRALLGVLGAGATPATLEYFDSGCIAAARANFPLSLPERTQFLVISQVDGSHQEVARVSDDVAEALGVGALTVLRETGLLAQRAVGRWRSGVSFAVSAGRGGKMSEDIVVPLDLLGDAIQATIDIGQTAGLQACSWGHGGDANLHATFMIDRTSPEEVSRAEVAATRLFEWTIQHGGTVSGEHGLGWIKRAQISKQFNAAEVELHRNIKAAFDPANLFNPGKKVSPASGRPLSELAGAVEDGLPA